MWRIDIPSQSIKFEKDHGKFHAELNILAIAYRPDGSVAARFSDNKKIEVENKKEVQAFNERPYYYDGQFDIASGQYTLKAAFSSGGASFGKVDMPLTVDPYDSKQFGLSGLALSKRSAPCRRRRLGPGCGFAGRAHAADRAGL